MLHLFLHALLPALITTLFFRDRWLQTYAVMMATMLVDLDHLLATPIYDPGRCSIGFHPLHEPWLFILYAALCVVPKMHLVGIGLIVHMALDSLDCQVTNGIWSL